MEAVSELELYLDNVYEGLEGYVYGASSWDKKWMQHFFEWPNDRSKIIDWVEGAKIARNVFLAPSVFSLPDAKKESWKASNVVWAELDGNPASLNKVPDPSIMIQSSTIDHQHWYWRVQTITDRQKLEDLNRRLAYALDADYSGWDCNQVLRPPETWNFKRNLPVKLLYLKHGTIYEYFGDDLDPAAPLMPVSDLEKLPKFEDVFNKYFSAFNQEMLATMSGDVERGKRSSKLMRLGYLLAQLGMTTDEIFVMLLDVDSRMGKFAGRSDQGLRLQEIASKAKQEYPSRFSLTIVEQVDEIFDVGGKFKKFGFASLQHQEVQLEWVLENLLIKGGLGILSGAPGVGKSQLTLDMISHLVLEKDYFLQKVHGPCKIGYLSLEMGIASLSNISKNQMTKWSEEEQSIIDDRFVTYALGEPYDLLNPKKCQELEDEIIEVGLNGLVIDALSSATTEALSDEKVAKGILKWVAHLRESLGVFVWIIHHNRKPNADNKHPKGLSDVFGSVFVTAQPDTVLVLYRTEKGVLELIPVKTRHSELDQKEESTLILTRNPNLTFTFRPKGLEAKEKPGGKTEGGWSIAGDS